MNSDEFFRKNLLPSAFAVQRAKDRLANFQNKVGSYKTGLSVLDGQFRLLPSELTVIGGRAGTGKTAWAMQIIHAVLMQLNEQQMPGCIALFSAEMDGETLMLREACALERIPLWKVQHGDCTRQENDRLRKRLDTLDNHRFLIDESPAPTLEHMLEQLDAVSGERAPVRFVVFDYTELSGEFDKNESQRIAKIGRGLKGIAKHYSCPVLTLSQLNRDIESRPDKTPNMRDLMHGGEREPDRIVILMRPWLYDRSQPQELVNCHIVKNRNGPLGEVALAFDETTMRFHSAVVERREL